MQTVPDDENGQVICIWCGLLRVTVSYSTYSPSHKQRSHGTSGANRPEGMHGPRGHCPGLSDITKHSFNRSPISLRKFNFCECLTKKCNFLSSIKLRIWHPVPEPNRPIPLWQDVLNRFFPCVGTHHWYSLNSKVQVHKGEMLERNCQIFLVVETDPCTIFEEDSFIFLKPG